MTAHVRSTVAALMAALTTLVAGPAADAQPSGIPPTGPAAGFVVLVGADTLAVERYARTAGRVTGELTIRSAGLRQTYDLTVDSAATVSRLVVAAYRTAGAPDAAPLQQLVARFDSAGATLEMGATTMRHAAPPGTLPFVDLSAAFLEQILLRARALGGASAQVPVVALAGAQNMTAGVRWLGPDSAVITLRVELRVHVSPAGAVLGVHVPAQNVRFVRADAASPRAAGRPDYAPPTSAPYAAADVVVPNAAGGVRLAGTLTVPRHPAGTRVPAVVLITGSGPQDRDGASPALPGWRPFRQIADTLGRRGIAVLRLDDRGVGGSDLGPRDATSESFAGDVRAALAFLRGHPDIDPARLALLGHSEGGMIAPMVAASDAALRGAVLVAAPAWTGRRISDAQIAQAFDEQGITGTRRDSLLRVNDQARDALIAATPWLRFWMAYDPLPVARRVRTPVLVVQGATDRQVTADQAEALAAAMRAGGNRDVTVRVLPEMNHLLVHDASGAISGYASLPSLAVRPDFLGLIADWLHARVRAR